MEHDFLSKEQSSRLKAILCIIVVFAHSNSQIMYEFGRVCVSVFFLLSGYAMAVTTWDKKISFKYIVSKFINILLPFFLVEILYRILFHFYPVEGEPNTLKGTLIGLSRFDPVVFAGWYIAVLLVLFVIFFISYAISKGNKKKFTITYIGLYLVLFVYNALYAHSPLGITAHFFLLGILMHFYKKAIYDYYRKNYWINYLMLLLPILSFSFLFLVYPSDTFIKTIAIAIFNSLAPLLLIYLALHVNFKGKFLDIVSKYSLFIYLTHVGIQFILVSILPLWGIKIHWIVITLFLASFAISFLIAIILNSVNNVIKKPIMKALRDK